MIKSMPAVDHHHAKTGVHHPQPHPHDHHHDPHHGHHAAPAKPHGHGLRNTVLALTLAGAVIAAALTMGGGASGPSDPVALLTDQMVAAASGTIAPTHAFGGPLAVTYGNGRLNVTAENLPSKACVQAGWHLSKKGTIIVNGTLPLRLSAAKLAELCGQNDDGATLTWVPD